MDGNVAPWPSCMARRERRLVCADHRTRPGGSRLRSLRRARAGHGLARAAAKGLVTSCTAWAVRRQLGRILAAAASHWNPAAAARGE
jgi:hypothetical protein